MAIATSFNSIEKSEIHFRGEERSSMHELPLFGLYMLLNFLLNLICLIIGFQHCHRTSSENDATDHLKIRLTAKTAVPRVDFVTR